MDAISLRHRLAATRKKIASFFTAKEDYDSAMYDATLFIGTVRQRVVSFVQSRQWVFPLSLFAFVAYAAGVVFAAGLPDVTDPSVWNPPHTMAVQDRNGEDMYVAYSDEERVWVDLKDIPERVRDAFIAIEDRRFHDRGCIDVRALSRAALANVSSYKSQGASTITQQLVRTALLTREKTFARKLKEIILACQVESAMTKDEILEYYLNWIPFGGGVAGVQQASRHFFGKDVGELTLPQAAVLASLPQRPSYFSPYGENRRTRITEAGKALIASGATLGDRRLGREIVVGLTGTSAVLPGQSGALVIGGRANQVIAAMLAQGYVGEDEARQADAKLLTLRFRENVRGIDAPHYVLGMVDTLEETLPEEALGKQLTVRTTIDLGLQRTAERLVASHLQRVAKKYGAQNVAMVLADTRTHEILAYVGNGDYFGGGSGSMIDMATMPRQPGSSFKPIVYAATMEYAGWKPYTMVDDTPLEIGGIRPRNYAGDFQGPLTVMNALNRSRNIPAIRAFSQVGEDRVLELAADIGASTPYTRRASIRESGEPFQYSWPLAIGAAEIPLVEMVQAYATFADSGTFRPLSGLRSVQDTAGTEYLPRAATGSQAIPASVADAITSMLSEARSRPAGFWRDITDIPNIDEAVKTGTSNVCLKRNASGDCASMLPRDVWAMGYTPSFVVGVWMGNVDGSPLTPNADGLNAAVPLWKDMLIAAHASPFGKGAAVAFTGSQAPYYTQYPSASPDRKPVSPVRVGRARNVIISRRP